MSVVFRLPDLGEGLTEGEISAAAQAARDRGIDVYLISLTLYTGHPYLASLTRRDVRERLLTASRSRAARSSALWAEWRLPEP